MLDLIKLRMSAVSGEESFGFSGKIYFVDQYNIVLLCKLEPSKDEVT